MFALCPNRPLLNGNSRFKQSPRIGKQVFCIELQLFLPLSSAPASQVLSVYDSEVPGHWNRHSGSQWAANVAMTVAPIFAKLWTVQHQLTLWLLGVAEELFFRPRFKKPPWISKISAKKRVAQGTSSFVWNSTSTRRKMPQGTDGLCQMLPLLPLPFQD